MTLVLTHLTPSYVVQVSDRLVTQKESQRPFDPLANKTVVYLARDGIYSIGYSGMAYLEGVPTDVWVAQKLRGERFDQRFAMRMGPGGHWLDIGQSVDLLRRDLDALFSVLPASALSPQDLAVAGWQRQGKRARPVLWTIRNSALSGWRTFEATCPTPRYWHFDHRRRHLLSSIGTNPLSGQQIADLGENLRMASPEDSQHLLVDAVRLAARRSRVVGPHCMCVRVAPPFSIVEVEYDQLTEHRAIIRLGEEEVDVPVAFSPWVVGRDIVVAPSIMAGGFQVQAGPITVRMQAPEVPPGRRVSAFQSQSRPPDPGGQ